LRPPFQHDLHAARSAGLEWRARDVHPQVDPCDDAPRHVQIVVLQEGDAARDERGAAQHQRRALDVAGRLAAVLPEPDRQHARILDQLAAQRPPHVPELCVPIVRQLLQAVRRDGLDHRARVALVAIPARRVHVAEDLGAAGHPAPSIVEGDARQSVQRVGQPLRQLGHRHLDVPSAVVWPHARHVSLIVEPQPIPCGGASPGSPRTQASKMPRGRHQPSNVRPSDTTRAPTGYHPRSV